MPAKVLKENGEHLRRLTPEEQLTIVVDALREAAADLEYQRHVVTVTEAAGSLDLEVDGRTVCLRTRFDTIPDAGVLVSWERLPAELLIEADRRRVQWFDFERRRCSLQRDWLFDRVRAAFSIRGVRFEPTAGTAAATMPDVPRAAPPPPLPD
jgi:hypothetical protein